MRDCISAAVLLRLLPALGALLIAASCEGPTPPPEGPEIAGAVLADATGVVRAHSHAEHWHGLLEVRRDQHLELRVYFVSRGSLTEDAPPREQWFTLEGEPEYTVQVALGDATVATWQGERYHATLTGRRAATTLATLTVRQGTRTVYQAPALVVIVGD